MNNTKLYLILGLIYSIFSNINIVSAQENEGRIQPYEENPYYWQYKGKPVLLLGGSKEDNLFQIPKLKRHLSEIADAGGNYIRNTMSDRAADQGLQGSGFVVYPFKELDNGKYDLDQWNKEYWQRFENMLRWTSERDIIVQIEVWDRFDYSRDKWGPHPYNPANNINYSYEESGFEEEYPKHPGANVQPFFFTTPKQQNNTTVLQYQKKFVNKLLDYALEYPNVLYCMDNETNGAEAWTIYWTEFIRQRANKENKIVNLTEMWDDWDLRGEEHRRTLNHPERYDYIDVSQNNHQRDETHWKNFFWVREYLKDRPWPINSVKIYAADGGKHGGDNTDAIEKIWRLIFAGAASARFHRPSSGLGLSELAKTQLRSARLFLEEFNIFEAQPDANHTLLSNRQADEAYLTRIDGEQYAVFFTNGGDVNLQLPSNSEGFQVRWMDISESKWSHIQSVNPQENFRLNVPGDGLWLALINLK